MNLSQFQNQNPLWVKEDDDGLYVDIFSKVFNAKDADDATVKSEIDKLFSSRQSKDNEKSIQFRKEGNKLFSQTKYRLALERYNQSLCYAEHGTDVMALAYSNRSSCYLKLKLFTECLHDIELAKQSKYPSDFMYKLEARQAECIQALSNGNVQSARIDNQKISLSFAQHRKYAGVADCFDYQNDIEWGRHFTTNRDLNINETLMIESPFSFVGHDCNGSKYNRCSHCFKALQNFIPCKECVYSMFCNDECLQAAHKSLHKIDCRFAKNESINCESNEKEFQLVLDMLFNINAAFETVENLIKITESIIRGDSVFDDVLPEDVMLKLVMILLLETNKKKHNSSDVQRLIRISLKNFHTVMRIPEFQERFVTTEHIRFLQHLILHLVHIAKQPIQFSDLNVDVNIFNEAELRDYGMGLYPIGSTLNHSCVPNVYCYSVDNRLICKVIRPIKAGEQLFRSYICGQMIINDDENDPAVRSSYDFLKAECKIVHCKCSSCQQITKSDPWLKTKDPNYLSIHALLTDRIDNFFQMTDNERQVYVDKAIAYLMKYESIHPSCETFVAQMFLHNYWMLTTAKQIGLNI